ncbi:Fungal Zn(2)-Cys(6) binuclear cluster domain-containing protein [Penicillium ucsense]|uniref:Fungal Zn(2)-Cys(6) binuclear cluster domain-containing protein n=1 Tax=Penicillium ucsense TaxID=2839758 RepID=A0A8J8WI39_9EURO|nr:Fungal Zn(2)-Cys(6) binuclear cluster domain-containing protein [Penicillium ucsense]KAF7734108.1 Fungal Zn(2)-Cys(6) binuclear cluster domain-containing protein [Penicillium ucsense]
MVGVPHSTGCALCRERHIKCDEAVPECTQCQRYGRACPGYRRVFRFQDEGPNIQRRHRSTTRGRGRGRGTSKGPSTSGPSTPTSSSRQTSSVTPQGDASASEPLLGAAGIVRANAIALMRRHTAAVTLDENVTPSLVRKTFRAAQPQLFLDFISASFPTLYFHNRFRAGNELGFAEFIVLNFGQDAYLDTAICCLSSVYLAHLTQDPVLMRTSRRMYGLSLNELIRSLSRNEHALSDNMVCTAMMLSVYEMYARTSPDAWVVHSDAVRRLMESRGPALHESGFGRSCWIAFRGFHIATAVYQGKPCFLDQPEWQDYTMRNMTEDAKKPGEWSAYAIISDKVFIEIAKCPRYISETRELAADSTSMDRDAVEALLQRIHDTTTKLRALTAELRLSITAHGQRQQGIVRRPNTFVGPVPEIFPETGPSLLLRGAENVLTTLGQLQDRLEDSLRICVIEELSPESIWDTPPSDGSARSLSPPSSTTGRPKTFTLPFRISSELGRGPSQTSDQNDPRAVIWLDRVASSMGMLGTKILETGSVSEDVQEEEGAS